VSESRGTQVCAEAYRKMKEVRYYHLVFKFRAQIFEAETRSYAAETRGEIFHFAALSFIPVTETRDRDFIY